MKPTILIAPNAFKGSYSSSQAALAIAKGLRRAGCKAHLDLLPLADGGPGSLDCLQGQRRSLSLHDALGRKRRAAWLMLPGKKALIESAQAIGLELIPLPKRNALAANSWGLGELLLAVKKVGCKEAWVGLGGSATTDGGLGMALALGWSQEAGKLKAPKKNPLQGLRLQVLCDVDNPLCGKQGAAAVYGPQKGASPEDIKILDERLWALAKLFPASLSRKPGAGAAGGLGFGLMAFCGAKLVPGAKTLLQLSGFQARLKASSLVVSGEGRFDSQSLRGKLPYVVQQAALRAGKPCLLLLGQMRGSFKNLKWMSLEAEGLKKLEDLSAAAWRKNLLDRHFS